MTPPPGYISGNVNTAHMNSCRRRPKFYKGSHEGVRVGEGESCQCYGYITAHAPPIHTIVSITGLQVYDTEDWPEE